MSANRRVLVVEDDARSRKLCETLLRHGGYEPILADSGATGLAAAAEHPPALVFLDIQLPDQSGVDVLRSLRARPGLSGVDIVALTAMAMPEDRERLLEEGFDEHVAKPIDVGSFLALVERRLGA